MKPKLDVVEFSIQDLLSIGMILVVTGIGIAYGISVMSDVKDDIGEGSCEDRTDGYVYYNSTNDMCANQTTGAGMGYRAPSTADFNATEDAIEGTAKIPEKMPTIATVLVAAIIIGILTTYLWARVK